GQRAEERRTKEELGHAPGLCEARAGWKYQWFRPGNQARSFTGVAPSARSHDRHEPQAHVRAGVRRDARQGRHPRATELAQTARRAAATFGDAREGDEHRCHDDDSAERRNAMGFTSMRHVWPPFLGMVVVSW